MPGRVAARPVALPTNVDSPSIENVLWGIGLLVVLVLIGLLVLRNGKNGGK